MSHTSQAAFDVRLEWGLAGIDALADCHTVIIVDVLSFSTTVACACACGAVVLPYPSRGPDARAYAYEKGAALAGRRGEAISLSPMTIQRGRLDGRALVLPSPNGSNLAFRTRAPRVLAGALRNRTAVARRAAVLGGPFAVIAAGEQWPDGGGLRPAFEDLVGAGAIAALLPGRRSPEADVAVAAFHAVAGELEDAMIACASGVELEQRGFKDDVMFAAQLDVCDGAPELLDGAFRQAS